MRILLGAVLATLLAASTAAAAPPTPSTVTSHDPPPPVELLAPQELWRVTDGDEDTGDLLGEIRDAAVDADGNTYLLDVSFNTVRIYDAAGGYVGTVGRHGEGPGEFQNPENCLALPDGRVGVTQIMPGQVITIEQSGDPGAIIRMPGEEGMQVLVTAQVAAGSIYMCGSAMSMSHDSVTSITRLQSVGLDGSPGTMFKEHAREVEVSGGRMAMRAGGSVDFTRFWAAGPDGRVYVAPSYDAYAIEVYAPDGTLERLIEVDYDPVKRTAEEIAAIEEQRSGFSFNGAGLDMGEIEPHLRDIAGLHPRPDGTLWVASSRGQRDRPAGAVGAFDVFDAAGKFVRRVAVAADFDPDYDRFVLDGDRLIVLKEVLAAPESTPGGGGGTMVIRMSETPRKVDPDREPMPYSVVCYSLSGI